jgi:predicted amidohydrolase YtcJ
VTDLVLVNGRVRTLDPERPQATAVAIDGGTIAAVGDDAEVRELAGASTEVIDLGGAALVPGITDSHMHPFMGAVDARGADLTDAATLEDVRRLVAEERARCTPDQWVLGYGLDYNAFASSGISGELIAEAAGGGPAFLKFLDFHTALATPRALELAQVDGPREFTEHAEIVIGGDGRPTGELRERGAMDVVADAMPEVTDAERYALCAAHLRALAAHGITGTHGMDGDLSMLDLLRELEGNGDLVSRLVMPFTIHPFTPEEQWEVFARHRDERGRRWRVGVAKMFIDGVIDTGTGWLFEPDSEGEGLSAFWPDVDRYRRAVAFFAGHGFQVVTHATGERGVHEALNAYRDAGAAPGVRHRIEHVEAPQPADMARFAAEDVIASMQAQHMQWSSPDGSDNWSRRLGPERAARAFPIRSLLESGATVTLGSDWPVARYDWRLGFAWAQLRRAPGHPERDRLGEAGISALEALHGYTSTPAEVVGAGDRLGRVREGYLADLTVLAQDPVETPADEIVDVPALLTVVDGEVVHRAL